MADVDLDLIAGRVGSLAEFLANLEEALFNLAFNTRLQLLLHVVKLEILAFEVLERIAFLLNVGSLHVLHDGLLSVADHCGVLLVLRHRVQHALVIHLAHWGRWLRVVLHPPRRQTLPDRSHR